MDPPSHPTHSTAQFRIPSHVFLHSAQEKLQKLAGQDEILLHRKWGWEEQCCKDSEICIFSCLLSSAIWDGVKPGPDESSFAKEAEPISGCFGTNVSSQMAEAYTLLKGQGPLPKPPPLPQMRGEEPERREIQCGLFLTCLIKTRKQSMSQNRKHLIKMASVKLGTQAGGSSLSISTLVSQLCLSH